MLFAVYQNDAIYVSLHVEDFISNGFCKLSILVYLELTG